jgi:hypothetical protein
MLGTGAYDLDHLFLEPYFAPEDSISFTNSLVEQILPIKLSFLQLSYIVIILLAYY